MSNVTVIEQCVLYLKRQSIIDVWPWMGVFYYQEIVIGKCESEIINTQVIMLRHNQN